MERTKFLTLQRVKKHYERVKNDPVFKEKRREYARHYREMKGIQPRPVIVKQPVVVFKGPITISFK